MYADRMDYKREEYTQFNRKFDKMNIRETYPRYNNLESNYHKPKIINVYNPISEVLSIVDGVPGRVTFIPNYLSKEEADDLFIYLAGNLEWRQREGMNKSGEKYFEPRMTCWFGKPYKYSGVTWDENQAWNEKVDKLRVRLSEDHAINGEKEYNSVMCNYYRDNKDSIGWHADDETSLGRYPKIASISLGSKRVFEVCKRKEYYSRSYYDGPHNSVFNGCSILYKFHLNHGSLLIMEGAIQEDWLHRVPKANHKMDGRINLTYRYIVDEGEEEKEINRKKRQYRKSDNQIDEDRNQSSNDNSFYPNKTERICKDKIGIENKRNKPKPMTDDVTGNDNNGYQNKTEPIFKEYRPRREKMRNNPDSLSDEEAIKSYYQFRENYQCD